MHESLEDIRRVRREKAAHVKKAGQDPYPETVPARMPIREVLTRFPATARAKKAVAIAGRLTAFRGHGALTFADLRDQSGTIQILFKKDALAADYRLVGELDLGDFIWMRGIPFKTKAGEKTLEVKKWQVLTKAIRPIPSDRFGLHDVEERFRKRYLDLLVNADVRARAETRSGAIAALRTLLDREGFMEVETPILQALYGGAAARPFKTHHDLLDIDLYLRIAPELYLKRLLVGGFEKVYEIGKLFRNEGIDREHNPEFTSLELYWAYQGREGMMQFTGRIIKTLVKHAGKKGKELFGRWPVVTFADAVTRAVALDFWRSSREELLAAAKAHGVRFENEARLTKGKIGDEIVRKLFVPKVARPTFLTDHPTEISTLAKADPAHPERALRFQVLAGGWELANGFAELNDPDEQLRRFTFQEEIAKRGEAEAMRLDEDFLEALEYGMPPAAGLGIGIDRLVAWLTDAPSLKEVILFPMMKPKE